MFFFNRQQIIEHSNGEEGLLIGDSEFRKASALVIATWFPFPIWFFVSPEGVGLIDNVLIIHTGWAFLNIIAKFSFIFYIQRIKDNYCNRLKVKREMYGSHGSRDAEQGGAPGLPIVPGTNPPGKAKGELGAVVIETMNFLGMAQHCERFLGLLRKADINSVDEVQD